MKEPLHKYEPDQEIEHRSSAGTRFKCKRSDLKEVVEVHGKHKIKDESFLKDVFQFGAWHANNVWPSLSYYGHGFQGYDTVDFEIVPCKHAFSKLREKDLKDEWMSVSAKCSDCGEYFGWRCKESPDSVCHYYTRDGEVKLINGSIDKELYKTNPDYDPDYESDDICLYCGHPEERK